MLSSTETGKQPEPGNAYHGMPSSLATDAVQGSSASETMALGGLDRTSWSNRACIWFRARPNGSDRDRSGRVSVDSQSIGRRVVEGNGIMWSLIGWLRDCERAIVDWNRTALRGVRMTVDVAPRDAKSFAMSIMGMMWPREGEGMKRTWICFCCAIVGMMSL